MWLYVPTSCRSAPEPEDSTLESDWRAKALAQSVTWSGKHSQSRTWLQRFRRVSWTTLLYGAILPPSMANRGVERWIGSLAASPASHTVSQDSDVEPMTNGTSGRTPPGSSERSDHPSSLSRMWMASFGITSNELGQSCEQWVTALRRDYSRRLRSAHRTSDNGSLSWPTPNAGPQNDEDSKWQERRAMAKKKHGNDGFGLTLGMATSVWPTALATDGTKAPTKHGNGDLSLAQAARMWPTATVNGNNNRLDYPTASGDGLATAAKIWQTPAANETTGGDKARPGEVKLAGQARRFPTPSVSDIKGFDGPNKVSPSKNYAPYSRLAQMTSKLGHECSPKCRRLNPRFVTWLMGWPGGWTLLPIARIDSESLAMEWCRWWELTRSALLRLGQG